MKFPPDNEKVDLAVDRWQFLVVIFTSEIENFHDFHEKVKFPRISWNFMIFMKKRTFCPKVHFGPPKPSIYAVLWKDFRPGPEKCAFFAKSRTFCLFSHFSRKSSIFMIFRILGISMEKHWFGVIQVAEKVAWTLSGSSAFAQKRKMMKISTF